MSIDITSLFDTLTPENVPRHLPVGGVAYRYAWVDQADADDWKADGYRWRNQGAAKKLRQFEDVGMTKTFFHVRFYYSVVHTFELKMH